MNESRPRDAPDHRPMPCRAPCEGPDQPMARDRAAARVEAAGNDVAVREAARVGADQAPCHKPCPAQPGHIQARVHADAAAKTPTGDARADARVAAGAQQAPPMDRPCGKDAHAKFQEHCNDRRDADERCDKARHAQDPSMRHRRAQDARAQADVAFAARAGHAASFGAELEARIAAGDLSAEEIEHLQVRLARLQALLLELEARQSAEARVSA